MATTFTWRPIGLKADQDLDGFVDAVTWVQWQCYGFEIDGDPEDPTWVGSAETEGDMNLTLDPEQPYIPMNELTDEIVLGWVWANGVDKIAVEAKVQALIDAQKPAEQSDTA